MLIALTLSSGVAIASNSVVMNYAPYVDEVNDHEIGIEDDEAYAKLSAEIDAIQAEYDTLYAQFVALAQRLCVYTS